VLFSSSASALYGQWNFSLPSQTISADVGATTAGVSLNVSAYAVDGNVTMNFTSNSSTCATNTTGYGSVGGFNTDNATATRWVTVSCTPAYTAIANEVVKITVYSQNATVNPDHHAENDTINITMSINQPTFTITPPVFSPMTSGDDMKGRVTVLLTTVASQNAILALYGNSGSELYAKDLASTSCYSWATSGSKCYSLGNYAISSTNYDIVLKSNAASPSFTWAVGDSVTGRVSSNITTYVPASGGFGSFQVVTSASGGQIVGGGGSSGTSVSQPSASQEQGMDFNTLLMWVAGITVVGGVGAYLLFGRNKGGRRRR